MAKKFLSPIVPPRLSSDPASAENGAIYYNTSTNSLKYYNGSSWSALQSGGGTTTASAITTSATEPSTPSEGQVYFDTAYNTLKVYNGTYWYEVGGPGSILDHTHMYEGPVSFVNYANYVSEVYMDGGSASSTSTNDIIDGGGA